MKTQKIFTIGEPCHEDWKAMTPTEKGRFCDACAKCVVDLRGKSQPEIQELFESHQGDLCGSMTPTQYRASQRAANLALPKPEPAPQPQLPFTQVSWRRLQVFAASFLAAFGVFWGTSANAHAQHHVKGKIAMPRSGSMDGRIISKDGKVKQARVYAYMGDQQLETISDEKGNFRFPNLQPGEWVFWCQTSDHLEGSARRTITAGAHESIKIKLHLAMIMGDIAPYEEIEEEEEVIEGLIIEEEIFEEEIIEKIELVQPEVPAAVETIKLGGISYHEVETPVELECTPSAETDLVMRGQVVDLEVLTEIEENTDLKSAEGADMTLYVEDFAVTVSPVPTHSDITIRIDESASEESIELFLFTVEGELVRTGLIMGTPGSTTKMDLSNLSSGIYFLKGLQKEYLFQKKVLKL